MKLGWARCNMVVLFIVMMFLGIYGNAVWTVVRDWGGAFRIVAGDGLSFGGIC